MSWNLKNVHPSWHADIEQALAQMDANYAQELQDEAFLPARAAVFNAFSLAKPAVKTVLLGESPYPRAESANGYAFWDAAVQNLWSEKGLDKRVNRATSLRNFIKMLLVARGDLKQDTGQTAISQLDKSKFISSNAELFNGLIEHGFLLLNASLIFRPGKVRQDAKAWQPFMVAILRSLSQQPCRLLLFGKIAEAVKKLDFEHDFDIICAEHPYNLSFIHNQTVINTFKPLTLLEKTSRMDDEQ